MKLSSEAFAALLILWTFTAAAAEYGISTAYAAACNLSGFSGINKSRIGG